MKNTDHLFKTGNKLGGIRGVSGRRKTLDVLDTMLSKQGNLTKFQDALQAKFDDDPVYFWKVYVMPVLPQNATNPKEEEDYSMMTNDERLQRLDAIFNGVRKRISKSDSNGSVKVGTGTK